MGGISVESRLRRGDNDQEATLMARVQDDEMKLIQDQRELIELERSRVGESDIGGNGDEQESLQLGSGGDESMESRGDESMESTNKEEAFSSDDGTPSSNEVAPNTNAGSNTMQVGLETFYSAIGKEKDNIPVIAEKYQNDVEGLLTQLRVAYPDKESEIESLQQTIDGASSSGIGGSSINPDEDGNVNGDTGGDSTTSDTSERFASTGVSVSTGVDVAMNNKLNAYYERYNPEKIKEVPKILKGYRGHLEKLSSKLKTKYGVSLEEFKDLDESVMLEEDVSAEMVTADDARAQLLQLYAKNEPNKLPFVDSLLDMYEGREGELLRQARNKFAGLSII